MSKIQDALDKLKTLDDKIKAIDAVNKNVTNKPFERTTTDEYIKDIESEISAMRQPTELTPDQKEHLKIISPNMHNRKVFNAFRDLRTSIMHKTHSPSPIIMVTSCVDKGGSSFVSLNLSAAISMDEAKTSLLIDCHLNQPHFSELPIYGKRQIGLKDYLRDTECTVGDIIYPTGISRLRIIPAGSIKASMSEYFTSARLHKMIKEIKQRYSQRYIIVDSPSIINNADTRILAEVCDYVILVIPYGQVSSEKVMKAVRMIDKDKFIGTVFNNQPSFSMLPSFNV